jgi:serine/threonine-protein kinase
MATGEAAMTERDLFEAALDLPPEHRAAYLAGACGSDTALRQRLEGLLSKHGRAGGFLEEPALSALATVDERPLSERPGTLIGPYKLLEQLGEGGFGVVFLAEQQLPLRRKVALKVLKPGMDTRQVVARFEAERQALALMDHPNIARVFDGGETASGRPYFVMELVRGIPITSFCDQNELPIRERLGLFVSVCQAMQHAHQKGIIHRDLKPSNVLVTLQDAAPRVKVIDFGIAKALGQQLTEKTLFTGFAQLVGTPLYMSPEQAALSNVDVDTRSDIYSLGVLLYELLTGTTPFAADRFKDAGFDELRRVLREEEPPRPSTRISTLGPAATLVATQRHSEPRRLSQLCRGELDWLVMKCLEKDRNRRYETAGALADDVHRYLNNEAVQACPPSMGYRLKKYTRRNKTALGVVAVILFMIALLGGGAGWVVRDWAARRAEVANNLERALDRTEQFQREGKREEALAELSRAELLASDVPADLARTERLKAVGNRLKAEAQDQKFVARFDDIRLRVASQVNVKESQFEDGLVMPEIRAALQDYGIDLGVTPPADAAARIQSRPEPVRRQVIAALDECRRWAGGDDQMRQWLSTVLSAADGDEWRTSARKALYPTAGSAALRLAHEVDAKKQPPGFLLVFARRLPTYGERLELFRRIQDTYPDDLWANLRLAHELSEAHPAEAIRYLTAALALRPKNPGIYLNRAGALKKTGEVDAAIADYRHCLDLAPEYAAARIALGSILLEDKHQLDGAIQEFRAVLAQDSADVPAHYCLGNALREKGQLDDAIREYRRTIALDAKHLGAHVNLGVVLYRQKHPDEAIREYRAAIALDSKCIIAHTNLAVVLRDTMPLCDGICFLGLDPKFALAPYTVGIALHRSKQLEEAIEEIRKVTALDPHDADSRYELGNLLRDQGSLEDAIAAYQEAIRIKKDFFSARWKLILAYGDIGQWDNATAACAQAMELAPGDTGSWGMSAILQLHTGDVPGYRRACRELLARLGNAAAADRAARTAQTCLLAPDAVPDLQAVLKLADVAIEKNGSERWNLLTKALAEYRAGRCTTAIEWLKRVDPKAKGESLDATAFALLAMARKRQGQTDQAHTALVQAQAILAPKLARSERGQRFGKYWENWLRCQIICREAESLLRKGDS